MMRVSAISSASRSKSKKVQPTLLTNQNEDWNSRFVLEQIPEYNPLTDKYCSGYRALIEKQYVHKKSSSKARAVLAPGGVRIKRQQNQDKMSMKSSDSQEERLNFRIGI